MGGEWRNFPFTEAVLVNPQVRLERGRRYPFVDMGAVNPGARSALAAEEREFSGGGSRFQHGDTLMARITPCLENGKIARFCASDGSGIGHGSTEFIVIRGRPGVTHSDFAYYLTQWEGVRDYAIGHMTGTSGRQRVPTDCLDHLTVPIPPLPEQCAIAHILGTLDDKIELNRRMSQTLEAMARALFKSWFVDFAPVRWKMERKGATAQSRNESQSSLASSRPGGVALPPALAALFPDRLVDSELGPIPEGWKVGKLGDVAVNPRRGVQPDCIAPDTPYIALEHMPRRCIALSDWGIAEAIESNKFEFKKGEILFGKLRPYFHKVGIAPVDGVCSTDIVVVCPRTPHWFAFVLGVVSSDDFVEFTNAGSTGTKMPRTSWTEMARYEIALPPEALAQAFTDIVRPRVDRIIAAIHESRTLAALRDALLPKLISGEIRVKAAERIIQRKAAKPQ